MRLGCFCPMFRVSLTVIGIGKICQLFAFKGALPEVFCRVLVNTAQINFVINNFFCHQYDISLKPGSHLCDKHKHKHKHQNNRVGTGMK